MPSEHEVPPHPRVTSASHTKSHSHKSSSNLRDSSSNLRDSLSFFGDDLVRMNDTNFLYYEGHEGDLGPGTISGMGVNSSQHQNTIQFERVPSSEVGVKSNRWRKALVAGLFTSPKSKQKISDSNNLQKSLKSKYYKDEMGDITAPFWGVSHKMRDQVSMLTLQLILHEMACFSSCVLLGLLLMKLFDGNFWHNDLHQVGFNRIAEAILIFLLVLTAIGCLLRIDTTDPRSLLTSPLYLIPVILMITSVYILKAWEFQRNECIEFFEMSEPSKKNVHLTQNCNYYQLNFSNHLQHKEMVDSDAGLFVMKFVPVLSCTIISSYLFVFRNKFYLLEKFGDRG